MTTSTPTYPTDHIIVNRERLVLTPGFLREGDRLDLDEIGADEQCVGCGESVTETLRFVGLTPAFRCTRCATVYPVWPGGYEE